MIAGIFHFQQVKGLRKFPEGRFTLRNVDTRLSHTMLSGHPQNTNCFVEICFGSEPVLGTERMKGLERFVCDSCKVRVAPSKLASTQLQYKNFVVSCLPLLTNLFAESLLPSLVICYLQVAKPQWLRPEGFRAKLLFINKYQRDFLEVGSII